MTVECFFVVFVFFFRFAGNNQNLCWELGKVFGMQMDDHERMI